LIETVLRKRVAYFDMNVYHNPHLRLCIRHAST